MDQPQAEVVEILRANIHEGKPGFVKQLEMSTDQLWGSVTRDSFVARILLGALLGRYPPKVAGTLRELSPSETEITLVVRYEWVFAAVASVMAVVATETGVSLLGLQGGLLGLAVLAVAVLNQSVQIAEAGYVATLIEKRLLHTRT